MHFDLPDASFKLSINGWDMEVDFIIDIMKRITAAIINSKLFWVFFNHFFFAFGCFVFLKYYYNEPLSIFYSKGFCNKYCGIIIIGGAHCLWIVEVLLVRWVVIT